MTTVAFEPGNGVPAESPSDSQIVEELSAAVVRRVPEWYGPGASAGQAAPIERRPWSFLLRFPVVSAAGCTARVVVKVPRSPEVESFALAATEPRAPDAVREYETLVAIWESVAGSDVKEFRAVRPLSFLEPWNAFAMEEVEGRNLKQMAERWQVVTGARAAWDRLERGYHRAGSWLALFHDRLGGAEDRQLDRAQLREAAAEVLGDLERASARQVETASLREALDGHIDALSATCDRVAVLHGDFAPRNMLLGTDGRIAAVDTRRTVSGSVYADVASMATDLSTVPLQVLTHGAAYRETIVRRCTGALLRGYFGARPYDPQLLAIHCGLSIILHRWIYYEERMARRRLPAAARRALAAWVRRYLRRLLLEWLAR